jgi:hypothetical protein
MINKIVATPSYGGILIKIELAEANSFELSKRTTNGCILVRGETENTPVRLHFLNKVCLIFSK